MEPTQNEALPTTSGNARVGSTQLDKLDMYSDDWNRNKNGMLILCVYPIHESLHDPPYTFIHMYTRSCREGWGTYICIGEYTQSISILFLFLFIDPYNYRKYVLLYFLIQFHLRAIFYL